MSSPDDPKPPFSYRPDVVEALDAHGFRPTAAHHPADVYDLLKRIYTFEIREAKLRHREKVRVLGPQAIDDLRRAVHALRGRYPVLSRHWRDWVERASDAASPPTR